MALEEVIQSSEKGKSRVLKVFIDTEYRKRCRKEQLRSQIDTLISEYIREFNESYFECFSQPLKLEKKLDLKEINKQPILVGPFSQKSLDVGRNFEEKKEEKMTKEVIKEGKGLQLK